MVGNLRKGITVVLQIAAYNLLVLYLVLHLLRLETWITTREREKEEGHQKFSPRLLVPLVARFHFLKRATAPLLMARNVR